MTSDPQDDGWYETEVPTRIAMTAELQRLKRRTLARPLPVIGLALAVTAGITYKVATKPVQFEAEVVLALAEGSFATRTRSLPVDQLREYFNSVLLPDNKLTALVEKYNLFRLRKTLGPQFALEQLRSMFEIQIWKNTFVYYDEDDESARRSARIGITVRDSDPDRAFNLAHELASIASEAAMAHRQKLASELAHQVATLRTLTEEKLAKLAQETALKQTAIQDAVKRGRPELTGILRIDLQALDRERQRADEQLAQIATSPDALANEIAAAGLDLTLNVVDERRPERPARSEFVLIMVIAVVGTCSLLGSALLLGAFDSRVHDTDDVARLGLPVLGQVPRFAGDNVGSMETRGAAPARVPSLQRWRSHR
jgi:capsular polysaccharide biosynthesis protein